jgi:hypothetical protein
MGVATEPPELPAIKFHAGFTHEAILRFLKQDNPRSSDFKIDKSAHLDYDYSSWKPQGTHSLLVILKFARI